LLRISILQLFCGDFFNSIDPKATLAARPTTRVPELPQGRCRCANLG
jgi:hypothetical protein